MLIDISMPAILFAIISYITWGVGIFFEAIAARRISSYSFLFWSLFLSFLLASFYAPFELKHLLSYTPLLFFLNISLSITSLILGTVAYYEALKGANRALVGTIASSFPIVTVVLSFLFLGERVTLYQSLAISTVFIGLLLSIVTIKDFKKSSLKNRAILLALGTMFCWGLYFTFIKLFVARAGWFMPNYIAVSVFPFIFIYMKIRKIHLQKPSVNQVFVPLFVSTVLVRIAEFSYNLGISKGLVALVAPIAGANPTLFVLLAFLFLKDPISKQQIVGIVVTLIGIVSLSLLSG